MEKPTVATPSPRMAALAAKRTLINDLMGGTFAMRKAGTKWLPQHPAESDGVYKTRLEKTFLDNFLELAITKASGKIFSKPIKTEEVPPTIEELLDNVDLQGSGLDPFAQEIGKRSLAAGISYVLVDVPPADGVRTAAEEKAAGIRPYLVHIDPDNVIEILTIMSGGREVIQRVRLRECSIENDGEWGYAEVQRVRVLEMRNTVQQNGETKSVMCYDVYQKDKDKDGKEVWIPKPDLSGATTFPAIFLVPFYSNRTGFMEGEPGFQNIAESTLEHWQWKSEHAHALSMCCFCMYTAAGVDKAFEFVVGPAKTLTSEDSEAKFGVLETTGKGVELAAKTLEDIESRIETAGVQLRVENAGKVTATAAAIDSTETNAGIVAVAKSWSDSWETALGYMGTILGIGDGSEGSGGEVEITTDTGRVRGTQAGLTEIGKARALGDLSAEAYIDALIWRGELPEDFDKETNAEACANEGPAMGDMSGKGNMATCPQCGSDMPKGGECQNCKETA